jgi:hypothetical protein
MWPVVVVMLALGACKPKLQHCYDLSTSPDGHYRLEGWYRKRPIAMPGDGGCSNSSGALVVRDLRTGDVIADEPTEMLGTSGPGEWSATEVRFEVSRTDLVTVHVPLR